MKTFEMSLHRRITIRNDGINSADGGSLHHGNKEAVATLYDLISLASFTWEFYYMLWCYIRVVS